MVLPGTVQVNTLATLLSPLQGSSVFGINFRCRVVRVGTEAVGWR